MHTLFTIPAHVAREVAKFASKDRTRGIHNVCLSFAAPARAVVLATNGHMLARCTFTWPGIAELPAEVPTMRWLVPAGVLVSLPKGCEFVDVLADGTAGTTVMEFRGAKMAAAVRSSGLVQAEGTERFPDVDQVIPKADAYAGLSDACAPVVGMSFTYLAAMATCIKAIRKGEGQGRGDTSGANMRFTARESGLCPIYIHAATQGPAVLDLDFVLLPMRV